MFPRKEGQGIEMYEEYRQFENLISRVLTTGLLDKEGFGGDEGKYFEVSKYRLFQTLRHISGKSAGLKILDVGSEPGYIAIALKQRGHEVIALGINLIDSFRERMDRFGIRVDVCNVESDRLPYGEGEFDVIIFTEVIEHLYRDPPHALEELNRVMKTRGELIVTTPNVVRLSNRIRLLFGRNIFPPLGGEGSFFQRDIYKRHNREYTLTELSYLLKNAGFKVNYYYFWNHPTSVYEKRALRFLKGIMNFVTRFLPQCRDLIFILAEKPLGNGKRRC